MFGFRHLVRARRPTLAQPAPRLAARDSTPSPQPHRIWPQHRCGGVVDAAHQNAVRLTAISSTRRAERTNGTNTDLDRTNGPFEVALVADVKGEDCCSDSVGKCTGKM